MKSMQASDSTVLAILARPYTLTRSQLGTETKIYTEKYICTPKSVGVLCESVSRKLATLQPKQAGFRYLISFSDKTHLDESDLNCLVRSGVDTGKKTERLVLKWIINHQIDGTDNELQVVIRIANPINPLLFLQAAMSKSAQDIDNFEFETGSTCASVTGAGQIFADEVFQLVQRWIDARDKPYSMLGIEGFFKKYGRVIRVLNLYVFPYLLLAALAALSFTLVDRLHLTHESIIFIGMILYFGARDIGRKLNGKIEVWMNVYSRFSVFQLTAGDTDLLTKSAAQARNSAIKLIAGVVYALATNILASLLFWWFTR